MHVWDFLFCVWVVDFKIQDTPSGIVRWLSEQNLSRRSRGVLVLFGVSSLGQVLASKFHEQRWKMRVCIAQFLGAYKLGLQLLTRPSGALPEPDIATLPDKAISIMLHFPWTCQKPLPMLPLFQDLNGLWAHQIFTQVKGYKKLIVCIPCGQLYPSNNYTFAVQILLSMTTSFHNISSSLWDGKL